MGSEALGAGGGHLSILRGVAAADANCANQLAVAGERDAPFDRHGIGQGEDRDAASVECILKGLRRTIEEHGAAGFPLCDLGAGDESAIHAFEIHKVSAGVDDRDRHRAWDGFSRGDGAGGDLLCEGDCHFSEFYSAGRKSAITNRARVPIQHAPRGAQVEIISLNDLRGKR
jgi:hypothetical protein